jgi:hypothetical protein
MARRTSIDGSSCQGGSRRGDRITNQTENPAGKTLEPRPSPCGVPAAGPHRPGPGSSWAVCDVGTNRRDLDISEGGGRGSSQVQGPRQGTHFLRSLKTDFAFKTTATVARPGKLGARSFATGHPGPRSRACADRADVRLRRLGPDASSSSRMGRKPVRQGHNSPGTPSRQHESATAVQAPARSHAPRGQSAHRPGQPGRAPAGPRQPGRTR